jgi:hypothetical protein
MATDICITTLGRLTFRRENGLSCNALGPFRLPVSVTLLSLSMMLCMSLVGPPWTKTIWMICMPFNCRVSDLACSIVTLFTCEMQFTVGSKFPTWAQVHVKGVIIPWLLTGHVSLCLEEFHRIHGLISFPLFTFLTQVCTFVLSFRLDTLQY